MQDVSDKTLKILHGSAALCHFFQFAYGEALINSVYKNRALFDISNPTYENTNVIGEYDLAQLVPIFSLLSTVNHSWALFDFKHYKSFVDQGYNPVRWGEYSISAGLMTYVIASLSGITDIKTLIGILLANVGMQYCGFSIEKLTGASIRSENDVFSKILYKTAVREQIIGFILFAVQMSMVWIAFFTSVSQSDQEIPVFVWTIIIILTALYLAFGVLSICYMRGANRDVKSTGFKSLREPDFRKVEVGYIILSFISKTFLMNMVLFGVVSQPVPSVTVTDTIP